MYTASGGGPKLFGGVKGALLIYHGEQLKRWKQHLTTILKRIRAGEAPPLEDHIASHLKMRMRSAPPNGREIIFVINTVNRSKSLMVSMRNGF